MELALFTPINITIAILSITSVFFMRVQARAALIALCALLALVLFGILEPSEALAGFSNSVVIMMVGLFIVGAGIFRTGLAKMISSKLLQLAGTNEDMLLILVMIVTAAIGTFVSNTGTVAVMIPIIVSMTASAHISARRYLMPLAFASSMATFTLISTPPNMVIQEILVNAGYDALGFFSFAPIGFVCLSVGMLFLFFASRLLVTKQDEHGANKKKGRSMSDLIEGYQLGDLSYQIRVPPHSPIIHKNLAELQVATRYHISIGKIAKNYRRSPLPKNVQEATLSPKTMIEAHDLLYCYGDFAHIQQFVSDHRLMVEKYQRVTSNFQESGFAEVFILPNSRLVNRTLAEMRFRQEYSVTVLAIQRNKEHFTRDLQNIRLSAGDAMLIQGKWSDIAHLADRPSDMVLVGQPLKEAAKVTLDQKAPVAALIMLLMVLVMAFDLLPAVIAVMLASAAMILTGCLRNMEEAYASINWESVILIGAMLPMSTAFEKTGAAGVISSGLVQQLGTFGPHSLLAGVYFGTSLMTLFISNTATAVLFAPIALQAAVDMGASPYPFLFAVAVSASMCFASPFSTPPNALVMSAGRYTFMEYVKIGLPLQVLTGLVMILFLPMLFPF